MTEEQIERAVERKMDGLDRRLMRGELTQAEYDREVCALDAWAIAQQR
jgi:hypothetical protein